MDVRELENVLKNEALARCRYEIYAEQAHKEGLHYIAKIMEETASNELSHVKEIMGILDLVKDTRTNVATAVANENLEATTVYPQLKELAVKDNEMDTARFFQQLTKIERRHKERFEKILELMDHNHVYERETSIWWKCRVCGYIHDGTKPPKRCPGCQNDMTSFEPADFSI